MEFHSFTDVECPVLRVLGTPLIGKPTIELIGVFVQANKGFCCPGVHDEAGSIELRIYRVCSEHSLKIECFPICGRTTSVFDTT